jgi:hypothetical protein
MGFWTTVSSLATAGATLFLAVATFMSVRSGNRTARAAERSMLAALRPLLLASHPHDEEQKVGFMDGKWVKVPGGQGVAEVGDDAIYLVLSVRNVGSGIGVLHGWHFQPGRDASDGHPTPEEFRRLTRDLYVAAGGTGFAQGALRDPNEPAFQDAAKAITAREMFTVDLLYGDHDGGQRVITRFTLNPRGEDGWILATARHWNVDRPDPR